MFQIRHVNYLPTKTSAKYINLPCKKIVNSTAVILKGSIHNVMNLFNGYDMWEFVSVVKVTGEMCLEVAQEDRHSTGTIQNMVDLIVMNRAEVCCWLKN